MISKSEWRKNCLEQRKKLSSQRRQEASARLCETLKKLEGNILSFTPIGSEIDTGQLNQLFAAENRLFLVPYRIDTLVEIDLTHVDCILVPGLAFDREHYRLGYGQGYYDRLLKNTGSIKTIGVGFREQLCEGLLPRDTWDMPVQELLLF